MFGGMLDRIAKSLMVGDVNVIERVVVNKLEDMGMDFAMGFLPPGVGVASRVAQAVATGGQSELDRMRSQWLSSLTPQRLPGHALINAVTKSFLENEHLLYRPPGKWQKWSKARQEWLDEKWRHDWRTQPRDWHGRWSPGRLRHPYISKGARRIRRVRRREARTLARAAARGIVSSWGR
jgi:hypothetical protein